jgi:hypothetical protein
MPPGWDPIAPPVNTSKRTRKFVSLQKRKHSVPEMFLTQTYLRWAYGVPKETFRRWNVGTKGEYVPQIPHNKGQTVLLNKDLASQYYSARCLYVNDAMLKWKDTPRGAQASAIQRKEYREQLKATFKSLPTAILEAWEKISRDKLKLRKHIKKSIVDDNNEQSYVALEEVRMKY